MSGPHIVGVTGGEAGVAATYAGLLALAVSYEESAGRMRGWAGTGRDTLLDPDLLSSALLAPLTFAEAEGQVLAATVGPDGIVVEALAWEVDATAVRLTVTALSVTDDVVARALASLDHLVGRTLGWTLTATASTWLPTGVLLVGSALVVWPHLPAGLRAELRADLDAGGATAGARLQRWITDHPALVEHAVAGGGGLLEGLWDGLTPMVPGGPFGVPLTTPDTASAAALLAGLYADGEVTTSLLPGVDVALSDTAPGDVADLVEHVAELSALSGPAHPEMNGTVELQTLTGADGAVRHVLYLPGTDDMTTLPWTQDDDVRDMGTNLLLVAGEDDGYARGVLDALDQAGVGDDPVLVVGHSQGGMLAADLLASASEHGVAISHAVTLGSPTGHLAGFPPGSHLLSLEHHGDVVPLLDGAANPDTVEQVTVTFETGGGEDTVDGVAAHHGFAAYAEGAALVDASADPSVRGSVTALRDAGFLGAPDDTVVTSRVFQVVRQPA